MDKLQDPWMFAGGAAALITVATYVWSKLSDPSADAVTATSRAAAVAVFSLLLLTWLARGAGGGGGALKEPFPT